MKPKTEKLYWWSSSSGRIEFQLTESQAGKGHHSGACDSDIEELLNLPDIKAKLAAINPALVAQELAEFGAWDAEQLADNAENLARLLWIACGDIFDRELID
jgi:hypothetical protein